MIRVPIHWPRICAMQLVTYVGSSTGNALFFEASLRLPWMMHFPLFPALFPLFLRFQPIYVGVVFPLFDSEFAASCLLTATILSSKGMALQLNPSPGVSIHTFLVPEMSFCASLNSIQLSPGRVADYCPYHRDHSYPHRRKCTLSHAALHLSFPCARRGLFFSYLYHFVRWCFIHFHHTWFRRQRPKLPSPGPLHAKLCLTFPSTHICPKCNYKNQTDTW